MGGKGEYSLMGRKGSRDAASVVPGIRMATPSGILTCLLDRYLPPGYRITPPVFTLLSANLFTIVLAIAGNWDAATSVFIFWAQSVTIGFFTVLSILAADTMAIKADIDARSRERHEDGDVLPRQVKKQQYLMAAMFAVHYGIFHLAYYDLLVNEALLGPVVLADPGIWIACGAFFFSHLFSFHFYRTRERRGEEYMNDTFIGPYFRIVPMHLIIGVGAIIVLFLSVLGITSTMPVLVIFLFLKTAADLAMHVWRHGES